MREMLIPDEAMPLSHQIRNYCTEQQLLVDACVAGMDRSLVIYRNLIGPIGLKYMRLIQAVSSERFNQDFFIETIHEQAYKANELAHEMQAAARESERKINLMCSVVGN